MLRGYLWNFGQSTAANSQKNPRRASLDYEMHILFNNGTKWK
jgi:hypothetical protein